MCDFGKYTETENFILIIIRAIQVLLLLVNEIFPYIHKQLKEACSPSLIRDLVMQF